MCTLVILRRPEHEWPLLVAANRDEMRDRPWRPPDRHWPERPEVVAGLDEQGGGSWLGVSDHGLVAAVANREGTLGPDDTRRSRGELVLEALEHGEAEDAARALADLEPAAYRAFNLFVGDPVSAFWIASYGEQGGERVAVYEVPEGLHMLTARDLDDPGVARIRIHRARFQEAQVPDPVQGDWQAWQSLLASRLHPEDDPLAAMNLDLENGFATVASHLVAIPRYPGFGQKPQFLFAAGPPDRVAFEPVAL